jgi:hypothetical protein
VLQCDRQTERSVYCVCVCNCPVSCSYRGPIREHSDIKLTPPPHSYHSHCCASVVEFLGAFGILIYIIFLIAFWNSNFLGFRSFRHVTRDIVSFQTLSGSVLYSCLGSSRPSRMLLVLLDLWRWRHYVSSKRQNYLWKDTASYPQKRRCATPTALQGLRVTSVLTTDAWQADCVSIIRTFCSKVSMYRLSVSGARGDRRRYSARQTIGGSRDLSDGSVVSSEHVLTVSAVRRRVALC